MNPNPCETPALYDDVGVSDAHPEVQKCVDRIYKASGKYPWDWLPRDYVPKVAAWGTNAALNLAFAVEAVHTEGSRVTMDDLRDFLVRKAKERQESSKNGKPAKPTMNSDCRNARKWIESKTPNSQSTLKQNKPNPVRHDAVVRQARAMTGRWLSTAYRRQPQDKLDDDDDDESPAEIDYDREMSVLSDISNVSSAIGPSDRRQPSLPPPPDRTSTPKRHMPPPPSPLAKKRSRQVEQFVSNNNDNSKETSTSFDADEESSLSQTEAVHLWAINRSLRTASERIQTAEFWSKVYEQELHNMRKNLPSINVEEVKHVLQKAARERDEKQEELRQLEEVFNSLATIIESKGGNCSEKLLTLYNGCILECENSKEVLKGAEDTLKAMEEETQKTIKKHEHEQEKIMTLEKDMSKQEEIIKVETRRSKVLQMSRFYLDFIEKLHSASDEVVDEEYNATVGKQESML